MPLNYKSTNFAEFVFSNFSDPKKPEIWSATLITPKERSKVILKFDMQPISKRPELYCWAEYGSENEEIVRFATKKDILDFYYDFWKEKMILVHKEHLINEENCIEDFCTIHYAYLLKPKPNVLE